jgi:hypothetical protein
MGPATYRDLAARANVGYQVARLTVDNMFRAGDLVEVGRAKVAHSNHWMRLYEPSRAVIDTSSDIGGGADALVKILALWQAARPPP